MSSLAALQDPRRLCSRHQAMFHDTVGIWAPGSQASSTASQSCRGVGSGLLGRKHCFTTLLWTGLPCLEQATCRSSTPRLLGGVMHTQDHVALETEVVTRVTSEAVKTGAEAFGPEKVLTCPRPQAAHLRQTTDRAPRRWLLQPARCRPSWSLDPSAAACDACLGPPSRLLCPTLPSFCPHLQHYQGLICALGLMDR